MVLALGEPTDFDETFIVSGFSFSVDKSVIARAKAIVVDAHSDGRPFITPQNPIKGTC